jgi:hypothetical protein
MIRDFFHILSQSPISGSADGQQRGSDLAELPALVGREPGPTMPDASGAYFVIDYVGQTEVLGIGQVVDFSPELQLHPFLELEVLEQREIQISLLRPPKDPLGDSDYGPLGCGELWRVQSVCKRFVNFVDSGGTHARMGAGNTP